MLDELLALDPRHAEARALRDKISMYYLPSRVGDTFTNSIGMRLAYIPAGEFIMAAHPVSRGGSTPRPCALSRCPSPS